MLIYWDVSLKQNSINWELKRGINKPSSQPEAREERRECDEEKGAEGEPNGDLRLGTERPGILLAAIHAMDEEDVPFP